MPEYEQDIIDAPAGTSVAGAVRYARERLGQAGAFRLRHNDRVMEVRAGESAMEADVRFARERSTLPVLPRQPQPIVSSVRAGGVTMLVDREANVRGVTEALRGHRLDTLSQDSGHQCTCGADSRSRRAPWSNIDEHRAHVVIDALMGTEPEPEPATCPARFIVETLADPAEDERMKCVVLMDPEGRDHYHRNASGDLRWQTGAEVSIKAILDQEA